MPETRRLNYGEAVNTALHRCLEEWPETLLYGEDVAKPGGVFGVTRGLQRRFGARVFDTPISESAILGSAVGAAMVGLRPIVEIMWADFTLVALDQIVNQAANIRYISNGQATAPLTIRTQQGSAPGSCAQHSQSIEAFFTHVPGIRVCLPSTPQDAHDLLLSAVHCDDPVVVIENRTLYTGDKHDVTVDGVPAPIGGARTHRQGTDLTVVTWGAFTHRVLDAVDALAERGIHADVVETPWLNPFPTNEVLASVGRSRRLAVVHEANVTCGVGAEVVARVADAGVSLDAPTVRIGLPDSRMPAAPALAQALMPDTKDIAERLAQLASR
jgi:pyruvate/2-oxoglutarate/acetoin dehydrogenase E1 component